MKNKLFNIENQKNARRKLRQTDIACEKIMWNKLRNNQQGYKFRRQVSIENYIVDFYCSQLKLVVEIDGAIYCTPEEEGYDKERECFLKNLGLIVKRCLNVDVKENLTELMYDLQNTLNKIDNIKCSEHSTSPPKRGRGPIGALRA